MTTGLHGKVMSCDGENRSLGVTYAGNTTSYWYGADGSRLWRNEGVGTGSEVNTLYLGPVEVRFGGASPEFLLYPHPSVKVAGSAVTYMHHDQLGSLRA